LDFLNIGCPICWVINILVTQYIPYVVCANFLIAKVIYQNENK